MLTNVPFCLYFNFKVEKLYEDYTLALHCKITFFSCFIQLKSDIKRTVRFWGIVIETVVCSECCFLELKKNLQEALCILTK